MLLAGWLAVACHQPSINAPSPSLLARGKCLTNPVFLCFPQILSFFVTKIFGFIVFGSVNSSELANFSGKICQICEFFYITILKERETLDESV
jgi:hypothetical protein